MPDSVNNVERLKEKVIEIDINLHEQKITLSTLEETMSRMVSLLEKLTKVEQDNATTKVILDNHDKRLINLEDRNKWVNRTIAGIMIARIIQLYFSYYINKKDDKVIISNSKKVNKKGNSKKVELPK